MSPTDVRWPATVAKSRRLACAFAIAAAAVAISTPTQTLRGQSTGAVLPAAAAFPRIYAGNCPAPIEFIGHITATVPGTLVDYQWERSDGSTGKVLHVQIGKGPLPDAPPDTAKRPAIMVAIASDKWRLALPGKNGQYWETLHILTPFDIRSPAAVVDVTCKN